MALMPGTSVRSTPAIRDNSCLQVKRRRIIGFLIETLVRSGRHIIRRALCGKLSHGGFQSPAHLTNEPLTKTESAEQLLDRTGAPLGNFLEGILAAVSGELVTRPWHNAAGFTRSRASPAGLWLPRAPAAPSSPTARSSCSAGQAHRLCSPALTCRAGPVRYRRGCPHPVITVPMNRRDSSLSAGSSVEGRSESEADYLRPRNLYCFASGASEWRPSARVGDAMHGVQESFAKGILPGHQNIAVGR
jgi:hypothetical protein